MLYLGLYCVWCWLLASIALLRDPNPPDFHPLVWVMLILVSPLFFVAMIAAGCVYFVKWLLFSGWKRLID